jgi:hypothetical protein
MKRIVSIVVATFLAMSSSVASDLVAFPGAEGFGMYTTGGRGGAVYHVTTLEDGTGEGTFRWACNKSGARTIVFDVSGTIFLTSELKLSNGNVTIAGQTAPGDGICIADYPFVIAANNVIVRFMRFRLGNRQVANHEGDGLGGMDLKNIIVDHCSVSWSIDECLSVYGSTNLTVQWCLVAQSLVNSGHSKGAHGYGGNWGGSGASYHHNLMAHHTSRVPRLGPRQSTQTDERMDMRNNVFYNWAGNGCYGGEGMNVNIVNNYYKPGPGTETRSTTIQKRIAGIGIRTTEYCNRVVADDGTVTGNGWLPMWHVWGTFYVNGNYNSSYPNMDEWSDGIVAQIDNSKCDNTFNSTVEAQMHLSEPIDFYPVTTHTAAMAYDKVLAYAGASLHRDWIDELIVDDTRNKRATYTGSGNASGFINSQDDNKPADADDSWSAWPTLATDATIDITDSDGDGMPDVWEDANGLDKNNKSDGSATASDGYTNLEHYLNDIVSDIMTNGVADGDVESKDSSVTDNTGDINYTNGIAGTISWPMTEKTDVVKSATVSNEISGYVTANDFEVGSALTMAATATNVDSDIYEVKFTPTENNASAPASNNAIIFPIEVASGYYFKPSRVSLVATRFGTDGGKIDISWTNDDVSTTILEKETPVRNNATPPYETYGDTIKVEPSINGGNLVVNIYSLGSTKQIGISNVELTGIVVNEDDVVTAVDNIESEKKNNKSNDDTEYILTGQKAQSSSRGLIIKSGKLLLRK